MAVEFKVEHGRDSIYRIKPKNLRPNPEFNGRYIAADITKMQADLIAQGQIVPLIIRSDGGLPVIIDGHLRWQAAVEAIKDGRLPKEFRFDCAYQKSNEQKAFLTSVRANHHRTSPNHVNDAHNIAKMERFGMTHVEIAAVYQEDEKWVKNTLLYVTLTKEGEDALASGKLKAPAARALAKLSAEQQREKLSSGKPLTAAAIKQNGDAPKPSTSMRRAVVIETLRVIVEDKKLPAGFEIDGLSPENAVIVVCCKLREML